MQLAQTDFCGYIKSQKGLKIEFVTSRKLRDVFHESIVLKFGSSSRNKGFEVVSGGARPKNSVPTLY